MMKVFVAIAAGFGMFFLARIYGGAFMGNQLWVLSYAGWVGVAVFALVVWGGHK